MFNATLLLLTLEEQAQISLLHKTIADSNVLHVNAVAAAVWVGYDILLTTDRELNRMWRRRFQVAPSLTYFITRYFSFVYLVYNACFSNSTIRNQMPCTTWGILGAVSIQIISLLVNGLLAVRVYAFCHGGLLMKRVMIALWLSESVIEVALSTLEIIKTCLHIVPPPASLPILGCISDIADISPVTLAAWWDFKHELFWFVCLNRRSSTCIVAHLSRVKAICFGLVAYRFLSVYFKGRLTNEIAQTFLHDGAILFIMVCGANATNIILLYALPKSAMAIMGFPWFIGASSIATSRTILSLRGKRDHIDLVANSSSECDERVSCPIQFFPLDTPASHYIENYQCVSQDLSARQHEPVSQEWIELANNAFIQIPAYKDKSNELQSLH
ncbi:hypothetical protein BC629DRAFT_1587456 [Irpex lacteus]|nr:hypothetical protein BC629DRAFT_1587456 [Irpex lacteus]